MRKDFDKEFFFPPSRPSAAAPKRPGCLVPLVLLALFAALIYFY